MIRASLYVIRRHSSLKGIYGDAPAAVEAARAYFSRQLGCVDEALSGGGAYLMGEKFNTADILLTTCLVAAARNEIPIPDVCRDYVKRTTSRAAYHAAHAANLSGSDRPSNSFHMNV